MANESMAVAVGKALGVMRQILAKAPPRITDEVLEAWCLVLEHAGIRPDQVTAAVPTILQRETFFPTPAAFLAVIRPPVNEDVQSELAWQRVRDCVQRFGAYGSLTAADLKGDDRALWCVDRMGWPRLCGGLGEENGAIWAAEFRRLYRLAVEGNGRCAYVAGLLELDNRAKGQTLTPGLCGRPDWTSLPSDQPAALPEKTGDLVGVRALMPGDNGRGMATLKGAK